MNVGAAAPLSANFQKMIKKFSSIFRTIDPPTAASYAHFGAHLAFSYLNFCTKKSPECLQRAVFAHLLKESLIYCRSTKPSVLAFSAAPVVSVRNCPYLSLEGFVLFNTTINLVPRTRLLGLAVCAAAFAGGVSSAHGALMLTISEPGYAPVSSTDSVTPGQVSIIGSYGTFTTDIEVGLSDINSPTSPTAYLEVESLDVTNAATSTQVNTLTVTLSESTPFTFPALPTSNMLLTSSLSGTLTPATTGDTVSFQSYVTPNSLPTLSPGLQTFNATTSTGAEDVLVPAASESFTRTSGFTLSDVTNLSIAPGEALNVAGNTTVSQAPVPEPVCSGLLAGAALIGLSRRARRRQA